MSTTYDPDPVPVAAAPVRREPDYPLLQPLLIAGVAAGALMTVLFGDAIFLPGVAVLFAATGATWRAGMPPIFPFCFFYLWMFIFSGYMFFKAYGYYPHGGYTDALPAMIWMSLLGLVGLVLGVRLGFAVLARRFNRILNRPPVDYDLNKLSALTIALFAVNFVVDVVPSSIWGGGAQILHKLLAVRFIPYFVLLVAAFQSGAGLRAIGPATAAVLLPQLLTGFSDVKEIMFVILLSALMQWRPWIRSRRQAAINTRVALGAIAGGIAIIAFGLIWQGGMKPEWRAHLWHSDEQASPFAHMAKFGELFSEAATTLDAERSFETLAARLASGALYFSYVIERVPESVEHENGALFGKAIANATMPRFLFPNKASLGGDSWLVRQYAGIEAAGDEAGASIGLGFMPEFYIDFGALGVFALSVFFGFAVTGALAAFATVSPTREVFIALSVGLLLKYFASFDGSFIKLFAGMLQHTIILTAAVAVLAPPAARWATRRAYGARGSRGGG